METNPILKATMSRLSNILTNTPEAVDYFMGIMNALNAFERKWPEAKDDTEAIWNAVLNIQVNPEGHDA